MNEFTLRFIPMLAGTMSCVLIFYIVKQMSTIQNAFLSFILVTCSNFYIYLSDEARCYSLFGFLVLLNLYVLIRWLILPKKIFFVLFLITLFFMAQIHYYSVFWIFALIIGFILLFRVRITKRIFISTAITLLISYSILLPLFLNQSTHEIGNIREGLTSRWFEGIFYTPVKILLNAFIYKIKSIGEISNKELIGIFTISSILLLSVIIFIKNLISKKFSSLQLFVLTAFILAFLFHISVGAFLPTVHPRYIAHFLILLFPFILMQLNHSRFLCTGVFISILLLNILASVNFFSISIHYIEPYREIAALIEKNNADKNLRNQPVISNFMNSHALAFYLKKESYTLFGIPTYSDIDMAFQPYRFQLFNNTLFGALYSISYFPKSDVITTKQLYNNLKQGYVVLKIQNNLKTNQYLSELPAYFKPLKTYKTNQGDIVVYFWSQNRIATN